MYNYYLPPPAAPPITVPQAPTVPPTTIPPRADIKATWTKVAEEICLGITPQALYDLIAMFISSGNETAGYGHVNKDGVIDFVTQATTGSGAHVVTSATDGAAASDRCVAATGESPNLQIHTHPNLGVFWSGTDEAAQGDAVKDGVKWGAGECYFLVVDRTDTLVRKCLWGDDGKVQYQDGTIKLGEHKMKSPSRNYYYNTWVGGNKKDTTRQPGEYRIGDEVSFEYEGKRLYGDIARVVTKEEQERNNYSPDRTGWLTVVTPKDGNFDVPPKLESLKIELTKEEQDALARGSYLKNQDNPLNLKVGDQVQYNSPTWGIGGGEIVSLPTISGGMYEVNIGAATITLVGSSIVSINGVPVHGERNTITNQYAWDDNFNWSIDDFDAGDEVMFWNGRDTITATVTSKTGQDKLWVKYKKGPTEISQTISLVDVLGVLPQMKVGTSGLYMSDIAIGDTILFNTGTIDVELGPIFATGVIVDMYVGMNNYWIEVVGEDGDEYEINPDEILQVTKGA